MSFKTESAGQAAEGRRSWRSGLLDAFWRDEAGSLLTSEYLILGTLLTLGLVAGISATRDSLVSEFEDYAAAILGLNTGGLEGPDQVVFDGDEEGTYSVVP